VQLTPDDAVSDGYRIIELELEAISCFLLAGANNLDESAVDSSAGEPPSR
jgi:hypothetical protein